MAGTYDTDYEDEYRGYTKGLTTEELQEQLQSMKFSGDRLEDFSVDEFKLANGAVGNDALADLAVTARVLAEDSVYTDAIQDLAITEAKIGNLAVGNAAIQDAAIDSAKIENLAVKTAAIDKLAVTGAKIAHLAVGNVHIQDEAVDNAQIAQLAVSTAKIQDAAVTNAKIDRATVGKLVVTNADIANAAVDTAKIKNLSVTNAKLDYASVDTAQIADAAITRAKIGDAQITEAQIASLSASDILSGILSTSKVTVQGDNGKLRMQGNRIQVFDAQSPAIERVSIGDVNLDGSEYGLRVRGADGQTILYDETGVYTEGITNGAITNPKISDDAVDGRKIAARSVAASHMVTNTITANSGIIADLAITNAMIANSTITNAKINNIDAGKITTGTLKAIDITGVTITGSTIKTSGAKGTLNLQNDAFTSDNTANGISSHAELSAGTLYLNAGSNGYGDRGAIRAQLIYPGTEFSTMALMLYQPGGALGTFITGNGVVVPNASLGGATSHFDRGLAVGQSDFFDDWGMGIDGANDLVVNGQFAARGTGGSAIHHLGIGRAPYGGEGDLALHGVVLESFDFGLGTRIITNPASGNVIFGVKSSGGSERFRVEHDGAVSTTNNTLIVGRGAGQFEFVKETFDKNHSWVHNDTSGFKLLNGSRSAIQVRNGADTVYAAIDASVFNTQSVKNAKKFIEIDDKPVLDKLMKLSPKKYLHKEEPDTNPKKTGLIFEEVEEVMTDFLTNDETMKGIDLYGMITTVLKGLQELTKRVEVLEN